MFSKKVQRIFEAEGEGKEFLPAYAWPGGYPIFYFDTDHNVYCPKCAYKHKEGAVVLISDYDVNWEDPTLSCDDCSEYIGSAYGDDEAEDEEDLEFMPLPNRMEDSDEDY